MKSLIQSLIRLRALVATCLLAAVVLTSSGCFVLAAGAAGAGTVAYIRGELDATLNEHYDKVIDASNAALHKLEFAKVNEVKDAFTDVITARTAQDKKVEITITKQAEKITKVSIRIGVFGDEEKSRAILEKINDAF
jgi:hypothetical protein